MTIDLNSLQFSKQVLTALMNKKEFVKSDALPKTDVADDSRTQVLAELVANDLVVHNDVGYKITDLGAEVCQLWQTQEGSNLISRYGLDEIRDYIKEFNLDNSSSSKS